MTVNMSLRKAERLPIGQREEPYDRNQLPLSNYTEKAPALPVPRYILATLYYALDDTVIAKKWADEALSLYTEIDVAVTRPAVKYYIAIRDWQHAIRFSRGFG